MLSFSWKCAPFSYSDANKTSEWAIPVFGALVYVRPFHWLFPFRRLKVLQNVPPLILPSALRTRRCPPTAPQKLLDNLDSEVDKGNVNLARETKRVELTAKETRTCWMYCTICLLLVVLIGLVCYRWH